MNIGYPDIPIERITENSFKTEPYVHALTNFIMNCATPMTIAIQGDWGTGKTSMMNMVQEELNKNSKIKTIMFNTWQYSQFDLGDQLAMVMLGKLASEVDPSGKSAVLDKVKSTLKMTAKIGLTRVSGGGDFDLDELFGGNGVDALINLKNSFQESISKMAGNAGRVVIFIDDLDRLEPQKAVELLEVLKIFLDCEDCVFVLAVDYSVVTQGVRAKYGEFMTEEKGRSFFDKIIQLPFKMPVARYKIDDYLKGLMENIWGKTIEDDEKNDIQNYLSIIDSTIGKNPRSIKRIVNSFTIINDVADQQGAYSGTERNRQNKQKLLFALLCIQLSDEVLYNYLITHSDKLNQGISEYVAELRDDDNFEELLKELYPNKQIKKDTPEFARLDTIIEIYCNWVEVLADNNENGSTEVLSILSFSSITGNSDATPEPRHRGKAERSNDIEQAQLRKNSMSALKRIVGLVRNRLTAETEITVVNERDKCYVSISYIDNKDAVVLVLERVGGFTVEIDAKKEFFDAAPENVRVFVNNHIDKNNINKLRKGWSFYAIPVINEQDEADSMMFLDAVKSYCGH